MWVHEPVHMPAEARGGKQWEMCGGGKGVVPDKLIVENPK